MAARHHITKEQIVTALQASNGLQFLAARTLGCHQKTIERAIKKYQIVAAVVTQRKGERTDFAEGMLWKAIEKGEQWAITFYLRTQGKDRGYTERIEFKEIKEMSDAELVRAIQERIGGDIRDAGDRPPASPTDSPTLH